MGRARPYDDIDDLPDEEVRQYSRGGRAAFKRAWNRAAEKGKDRRTALQEAHIAATQQEGNGTR